MGIKRIMSGVLIACLLLEGVPLSAQAKGGLGQALEKAKGDYSRLEFDAAKRVLQKGLVETRRSGLTHEDSQHLIPATTLLGELFYVLGDLKGAKAAFEDVVRMDPALTLDEKRHAPQVRRLFDETRQKLFSNAQPSAQMKVSSDSGKAKVYLNGVYKGETPLQIKGIFSGRNVVTWTQKDKAGEPKIIEVSGTETVKVSVGTGEAGAPEKVKVAQKEEERPLKSYEKKTSPKNSPYSKPFWKRPLVWIIGGVILAGAGAGIGIMMGGSSGASGTPAGTSDVPVTISGSAPTLR